MRRKLLIAGGLALLLFTAVWQLALAPRWTQRIRSGWTWETTYIGYQTFVDSQTGKMPEKDVTSLYKYSIIVVPGSERSGFVELYNNYVIYDIVSGKIIMEFKYSVPVNPQTGEHLDEAYRGDYFQFPKNVEKKTYNLRFAYLKGIPVAFQKEDEIGGLNTYLFTYRGRGEYTEAYAGTEQFPGIKVEPGQEIKCADDQFTFKTWVEPMTGKIIKIEEDCQAGSFIYDVASGTQLQAVDRWSGVTAGDDVVNRVKKAGQERARQLWINYYIPSLLLLTGLLCFGLVLIPGKNKDV
jgi:hypothetical protein